jgi:hypothetical protein
MLSLYRLDLKVVLDAIYSADERSVARDDAMKTAAGNTMIFYIYLIGITLYLNFEP